MLTLNAEAARVALPFDRLIATLREHFTQTCEVPLRHVHDIASPGGGKITSLLMPAWLPGRYYGVKIVNIAPGNTVQGLPGLHSVYLLFDARTGVPLAHIDGNQITARRTVAASALAASYLARTDARHLLVVGAGAVAALLPEAYRAVRPIEQVTVWARRADQAQALAAHWRAQGFDAAVATDLPRACAQADVVSCATLSTEPLVQGAWLAAGSHLDLIGSFTPSMCEADDGCFAHARVFVDTEEALQKSGDLIGPLARGVLRADDVRGTLGTLCKGVATGRKTASERTVFKSVGTALEDLAAAVQVFEAAR